MSHDHLAAAHFLLFSKFAMRSFAQLIGLRSTEINLHRKIKIHRKAKQRIETGLKKWKYFILDLFSIPVFLM